MTNPSQPDPSDPLSCFRGTGDWAVCHARPRCEKKIHQYCSHSGIPSYLPLVTSEKTYGTRVREHTLPLFTGYLFIKGGPEEHQLVRQNQLCANLIPVLDQAQMQTQLNAVEQALQQKEALQVVPYIEEGRRVQVTRGPFIGTEGIITQIHGQDHIVICFEMIHQSVALRVDWSMLKPVD